MMHGTDQRPLEVTRLQRPAVRAVANPAVWLPICGVAMALSVWEGITQIFEPGNLPSATDTIARTWSGVASGEITETVAATLTQWAIGFGLVCLIFVPIGLIIGRVSALERYTQSSVDFARSIPPVILIPLFALVLGSGLQMVVIIVLFGSCWPLLIHTIAGAQSIDRVALDAMQVFRLSRLRVLGFVVLPGALPDILTGARIAAAYGLFITIAAQLIIGAPGLGRQIAAAQLIPDLPLMYGAIVVTGILGVGINALLTLISRLLLPWQI